MVFGFFSILKKPSLEKLWGRISDKNLLLVTLVSNSETLQMRNGDVFFILSYFFLLLRNLNPVYFKKTGHCRTVVHNRKNFSKLVNKHSYRKRRKYCRA